MSFKEDKKIDLNALHIEWQKMPELVEKWSSRLAEKEEELNIESAKLDLEYGEKFLDVKKNPGDYEFDKQPSDKICDTIAKTSDKYQSRLKTINSIKKEAGIIKAAVSAMSAKKAALGNEVSLWIAKYYSEPTTRIKEDADNIKEKIDDNIREKSRKKLRSTRKKRG